MAEGEISGMLRRDDEEWRALCALLDEHPGGPVHDPESPDWEAHHVYAHFARWLSVSNDALEAAIKGRPAPGQPQGDDDSINARWRAEDDAIGLAEARRRAHDAWARRQALIESVPDDGWTPELRALAMADGYEHVGGHRRYVEAAARGV